MGAPEPADSDGWEMLRNRLEDAFETSESKGSFACYGLCDSMNPGLEVEGTGLIGLPLSDREAEALKSVSHKAPFGKDSETIIDDSVRKTWEINADMVRLANPKWNEYVLRTLMPRICNELGLEPGFGIRPELYKLLLYDQGAMFKPHQEHVPGIVYQSVWLTGCTAPKRPLGCSRH